MMASIERSELINKIDELYRWLWDHNRGEEADSILDNAGASSDDSDPNEGMYKGMSDQNLQKVYNQFNRMKQSHPDMQISIELDVTEEEADVLKDALVYYARLSSKRYSDICRGLLDKLGMEYEIY